MTVKYEMPALTDEQRESQIKYLIGAIDAIDPDCAQGWTINAQYRLPFQIALAALTAETFAYGISDPDGGAYFSECCIDSDGAVISDEVCALNDGETDVPDGYKVVRLYTAPPVPALKLPDEADSSDGNDVTAWVDEGWNNCLAEVKRLNGVTDTAPAQYESLSRKDPENG